MIIIAFLFATGLLLSLLFNGYIQSWLNGNHEIRVSMIYIDKIPRFEIEIREVESNNLLYGNTLTSEETAAFLKEFNIPKLSTYHMDLESGMSIMEIVRHKYPSNYTQEYVDYIDKLRNSSIYE